MSSPNIQVTERDLKILKLVAEYRFLRSSHIPLLIAGSKDKLTRRLSTLAEIGLLERLSVRRAIRSWGGSESRVYGLGREGARLLQAKTPLPFDRLGSLARHQQHESVEHELMISDFMTPLAAACRRHEHIRLIDSATLRQAVFGKPKTFVWSVSVTERNLPRRLTVFPDHAFALWDTRRPENQQPAYFFFEADRGTMPVVRRSFDQTSYFRKLVAYHETWRQLLHTRYFRFPNFRVITLTSSRERLAHLLEVNKQFNDGAGSGLFLFAEQAALQTHGNPLTLPLKSGRGEAVTRLADG